MRSKAADDAIRDEYEPVQTLQIVEVPTREPEREARLAQPPTPIAGAADSVDLAIDNLLAGAANARPLPNPEARRHDLQAAAETFRSAAPALARPLSELMFQLSVGRTPRGWAIACQAVVTSLLEAAKRVELEELATSLEHFDAALKRAVSDAGPSIDAATAAALQAAYGHLTSQLPDAFPAASEADGRRKLLFEAVVLRAPAMRMRILAKLYAAGVNSLEQLCRTTPEELSTAAGIDRELAQALTRRAQQFNRERHQDPADLQTQTERRLRALRQRLEALQSEFERAEREDLAERKRAVRQGREAALLELNQLLAEAGEFELANELQRYPTSAKILSIESYLKRAQTGPE